MDLNSLECQLRATKTSATYSIYVIFYILQDTGAKGAENFITA